MVIAISCFMYAQHQATFDAKNRVGLPEEMPLDYTSIAHVFQKQPTKVTSESTPPTETIVETPIQEELKNWAPGGGEVEVKTNEKPAYIPQNLWDLMQNKKVAEKELQECVYRKGFYPIHIVQKK